MPRVKKFSFSSILVIALFLISVFASVGFNALKQQALGFHSRDLAFYYQFAVKLFDTDSAKQYSLNPEGRNWMFMEGTDGDLDFQRAIHFEPMKYIYALMWRVFGSPLALYALIGLILFSPPLYAMAIFRGDSARRRGLLLFALLYFLYPSIFFAASYDLRPYIFLAPFFLNLILAMTFERPAWEMLLFFNGLFLAREEALIFGGAALLYYFIKNYGATDRQAKLLWLGCSYLAWLLASVLYFRWANYGVSLDSLPFRVFNPFTRLDQVEGWLGLLALAAFAVSTLYAAFTFKRWVRHEGAKRAAGIIPLAMLIPPLGYELLTDAKGPIWEALFFDPRYFLLAAVVFSLLIAVPRPGSRSLMNNKTFGIAIALILLLVPINVFSARGIVRSVTEHWRRLAQTEQVWQAKADLDADATQVLVDMSVYQAFCDLEQVYVLERLPASMVERRYSAYPANADLIQGLLAKRISHVIVGKDNQAVVEDLMPETSIATVIFDNGAYIGYQIGHR